MHTIAQSGHDTGDHGIPVAPRILSKLTGGRIPGAIVTIEQPSPARVVAIEEPERLAERSAARGNKRRIARELNGIAKTLLGMEQNGLAGDRIRAKP